MNPDIKARWVAALRSGEYVQGEGFLKFSNTLDGEAQYCCLGVLCEIAVKDGVIEGASAVTTGDGARNEVWRYGGASMTLPRDVRMWAGLADESPEIESTDGTYLPEEYTDGYSLYSRSLTDINDIGTPFETIANMIEDFL